MKVEEERDIRQTKGKKKASGRKREGTKKCRRVRKEKARTRVREKGNGRKKPWTSALALRVTIQPSLGVASLWLWRAIKSAFSAQQTFRGFEVPWKTFTRTATGSSHEFRENFSESSTRAYLSRLRWPRQLPAAIERGGGKEKKKKREVKMKKKGKKLKDKKREREKGRRREAETKRRRGCQQRKRWKRALTR